MEDLVITPGELAERELSGPALFYTTFNLPIGVYVMRNSFLQVPAEIVDAARVDYYVRGLLSGALKG